MQGDAFVSAVTLSWKPSEKECRPAYCFVFGNFRSLVVKIGHAKSSSRLKVPSVGGIDNVIWETSTGQEALQDRLLLSGVNRNYDDIF